MKINVNAEELVAKIGLLKTAQYLRPKLRGWAFRIKGKMAQYPPSSSANVPQPYPGRWYQRGYGPKWALKGGGANGRKTSEMLGKRWTAKVSGLSAKIGNSASYGVYVQSAQKQAKFHANRGWTTDEEVLKAEAPRMERELKEAVEQLL